jgi:pimeloyl-ACP methyl ester carboxylesterase
MKRFYSLLAMLAGISWATHLHAQCQSYFSLNLHQQLITSSPTPAQVINLINFHNSISGNKRVIFLVPGLNGDYNAWRDVRDETGGDTDDDPSYPARKADLRMFGTKHGPGYSQDAGLASAAKDVWDEMSLLNYPQLGVNYTTDNIAIGHSQGGLVLRAVEYATSHLGRTAYFGGVVTFGTPHQGAAILTNGLPVSLGGRGQLGDFINDFCVKVSDGPVEEKLQLSDQFLFKLVRILNLDDDAKDLKDQICETLADSILPHYILKDYTANITQDYMAHDNRYSKPNFLMNTLNLHQPTVPMVAFYGVEEEPVFWRQLGSITEKVHSFPAFQADPDQSFVDSYAQLKANYRAKQLLFQKQADDYEAITNVQSNPSFIFAAIALPIGVTLYLIYDSKRKRAQKVADAYKGGHKFLSSANARWKGIIGARKTSIKRSGYICDCDYVDAGYTTSTYVPYMWDCPVGMIVTTEGKRVCQVRANMVRHIEEYENDGVVLASSAKQLPGALVNPALSDQDYRMDKTNHQQMRNCSETAIKLKRLFDYPDYGYFFMTPRI